MRSWPPRPRLYVFPEEFLDVELIGAGGYGISALLYGGLAVLLLARLMDGYLVAACALSAIWAGVNAWQLVDPVVPVTVLWVAEILRTGGWLFFLIALLAPLAAKGGMARDVVNIGRFVLFALVSISLLSLDETMGIGAVIARSQSVVDVKVVSQLLLSVGGMTVVEQVLRNSPAKARSAIKYLCLVLGAHFLFDFYLYADALMFRRLDPDIWLARGAIHLLTIPLLLPALTRNPDWSMPLTLSRRAALHTTALLGSGTYLLLMALAGYYIKLFGGEWGTVMRTVFLFGSGVMLATLFFSERLRAHLRVLISKHFFHYRYDYRDEWLKLIGTLTGRRDGMPLEQRVIAAIGEIVDSPGGILFLVDERGGYAVVGQLNQPPLEISEARPWTTLVAFLATSRWVIDIDEYKADRTAYAPVEMPEWVSDLDDPWLIVPLLHDDRLNGFVVLMRPRAKQQLDWESLDLLKTAGLQAASYLALDQAAESLAEARQFDAFNRLSAFVVHDLKNLIAQLSLVIENAHRHKANPAFIDDAIDTVKHSVAKMKRLLEQLRLAAAPPSSAKVNLGQLLETVVDKQKWMEPAPSLSNLAGSVHVSADPERLATVIGHVVQNAQEATPSTGTVVIQLERSGDHALVIVRDSGHGMEAQFMRDRLFKPFQSTKGLTGMGIGVYECREFVNALGGWVDVTSAPMKGTTFTIGLPIAETPDSAEIR